MQQRAAPSWSDTLCQGVAYKHTHTFMHRYIHAYIYTCLLYYLCMLLTVCNACIAKQHWLRYLNVIFYAALCLSWVWFRKLLKQAIKQIHMQTYIFKYFFNFHVFIAVIWIANKNILASETCPSKASSWNRRNQAGLYHFTFINI